MNHKNNFLFAVAACVILSGSASLIAGKAKTKDSPTTIQSAIEINRSMIDTALGKHSSNISIQEYNQIIEYHLFIVKETKDDLAKNTLIYNYKDFVTTSGFLKISKPRFLSVEDNDSFFERSKTHCCCYDKSFEGREGCYSCWFLVPCYLTQYLCGCCLPCGWKDGCCLRYETPEKNIDFESMKKALNILKTLYGKKDHWEKYYT